MSVLSIGGYVFGVFALIAELSRILRFGGPPPNWVRRGEGTGT